MFHIKRYDSTNKTKGYNVSIGGKTPKFIQPIINTDRVIDLYERQYLSLESIAKEYNVSRWTITMELKNRGIKIRDRHDSACKINKLNR